MALSTLSPPPQPPFAAHSSALPPKLHHLSVGAFFPANNSLSASTSIYKWRTNVSFFTGLLNNKTKNADAIKQDLLDAIAPLDRGAEATPDDQQTIDQIAGKLEAVNPTKQPLKSELLNGKWELIYTTSQSILQTKRPKFLRSRTNYQAINADVLRAQNMESAPFFNQVTADLTPLNAKKVAVKFDFFKIAGLFLLLHLCLGWFWGDRTTRGSFASIGKRVYALA